MLSDILHPRWVGKWNLRLTEENYVRDIKEYKNVYRRVGFRDAEVVDATNECWMGFRQNLARWTAKKLFAGEIGLRTFSKGMLRLLAGTAMIRHYFLVSARKA